MRSAGRIAQHNSGGGVCAQLRGDLGQIAKFKELRDGAEVNHTQQDVASEPQLVRRHDGRYIVCMHPTCLGLHAILSSSQTTTRRKFVCAWS